MRGKKLGRVDWELAKNLYSEGFSLNKVGKHFGVSGSWIQRNFIKLGVPIRTRWGSRNLELNEDAFSTITPESAYWIGFLMADGCVANNSRGYTRRLDVAVGEVDFEHIEKLSQFLNYKGSVYKMEKSNYGGYRVRISVVSRGLTDSLMRYGVVPKKTGREMVFGLEDNRDFWRGVIDGDGTIGSYQRGPAIGLCGSYYLLRQFCNYASLFGIKINPRRWGNYWVAGSTGKNVKRLIEHLYVGSDVYLERKWRKAMKICGVEIDEREEL